MKRLLFLIVLCPAIACSSGISNPTTVPGTLPTSLPLPPNATNYLVANPASQESKTVNVSSGTVSTLNTSTLTWNGNDGIYNTVSPLADVSQITGLSTVASITFSTITVHCYGGQTLCVTEGNGAGDPPRVMISTGTSYRHGGLTISYPLLKPGLILDNPNPTQESSGLQIRSQDNGELWIGGEDIWNGTVGVGTSNMMIGTYNNDIHFYTNVSTVPIVIVGSNTQNSSMLFITQPVAGKPTLTLDTSATGINAGSAIQFKSHNNGIAWIGTEGPWLGNTSSDTVVGAYNNAIRFYTNGGSTADLQLTSSSATTNVQTFIKGSATNDSAPAGYVGEYVTSAVSNTAFPSNGLFGDLTSINLTAGDWDVTAQLYDFNNGATATDFFVGISTHSGNDATALVSGDTLLSGIAATAAANNSLTMAAVRQTFATTTTVYLKFSADYSVGTPHAYGRISARRMR